MIDLNKPIRHHELKESQIIMAFSEDEDVYPPKDSDIIPEAIDEIILEVTCDYCGEKSQMVITPYLQEEDGGYYPVMKIRRVSEK